MKVIKRVESNKNFGLFSGSTAYYVLQFGEMFSS